jgi:hypothetical protein
MLSYQHTKTSQLGYFYADAPQYLFADKVYDSISLATPRDSQSCSGSRKRAAIIITDTLEEPRGCPNHLCIAEIAGGRVTGTAKRDGTDRGLPYAPTLRRALQRH